MSWLFQKRSLVTYMISCRNKEYCKLLLDSISKQHRNAIWYHETIPSSDPKVKKADFIVEVANERSVKHEFEKALQPNVSSMQSFTGS